MPAPAPAAPPPGAPPGTPPVSYILLAPEGDSPPIKLTTTDAQKIQDDAGIPVEQLEEKDLRESMTELHIQSQPLTPQDQAALGIAPTPTQTGSTTTVMHHSPTPSSASPSMEDQLKSLDSLKSSGLITEDDYNAKKKQVLGL
jgi:Short C-terminal domain